MNVAPLIKDMVINAGFQEVEEEIYKVFQCPSYGSHRDLQAYSVPSLPGPRTRG